MSEKKLWFEKRNISSNTGGTDVARIFTKYGTKEEYEEWLKKLPTSGTKYMEWGLSVDEFLNKHLHSCDCVDIYGVGTSHAEVCKCKQDGIFGNNCEEVYKVKSFAVEEESIDGLDNANYEFYSEQHDEPGRYDTFEFLVCRDELSKIKFAIGTLKNSRFESLDDLYDKMVRNR